MKIQFLFLLQIFKFILVCICHFFLIISQIYCFKVNLSPKVFQFKVHSPDLNISHQNSAGDIRMKHWFLPSCIHVSPLTLWISDKSSNGWPSLLHLLWLCGHSCFPNLGRLNLSLAWPHAGNQSSLWPTVSLLPFSLSLSHPVQSRKSRVGCDPSETFSSHNPGPAIILHLLVSFLQLYQFFNVAPLH